MRAVLLPTVPGMRCYFKGASSREMLICHPQLLAQHISLTRAVGKERKKKKKDKEKQNRSSCSASEFTSPGRHDVNYIQGSTLETNLAVIGEHPDNWPKVKCLSMVLLYGLALESRENMPTTVLVTLPYQHSTFRKGEAHDGRGKESTFQAVTQHIKPSMFGKAIIQWTPHLCQACPSLLVNAFDQCNVSGKRNWNQAWRPACQPFCSICPQGPLEQGGHVPLVSLQGHSLEQGHSKAESAWSHVRFLKFSSEDTIWQRKCHSFGAITENLQNL